MVAGQRGEREEGEREREKRESKGERCREVSDARWCITTRRLKACHLVAVISCVVRVRRRMWRDTARAGTSSSSVSSVAAEVCVGVSVWCVLAGEWRKMVNSSLSNAGKAFPLRKPPYNLRQKNREWDGDKMVERGGGGGR